MSRRTKNREQPSLVEDADWLFAKAPKQPSEEIDESVIGKWLVFAQTSEVDEIWRRIFSEVERNGLAGSSSGAKVSTAASPRKGSHVICVYTGDFRNKSQVGACLSELRRIGINGILSYKTDEQTRARVYSKSGSKASIYRSTDFEKHKSAD